jgi:hypothetical protein
MPKYIVPASRGSRVVKGCKISMPLILIRYYSPGQSKAVLSFKNEGTFRGVIINYFDLFGPDANMENPTVVHNVILALWNLWKLVDKIGQAPLIKHTAFAQALASDRTEIEVHEFRDRSQLLLGLLGYLALVFCYWNLIRPNTSIIFRYWQSFLALRVKGNPAFNVARNTSLDWS